MTTTLDRADAHPASPPPTTWRQRLAVHLSRWSELLRGTHDAGVPF